MSAISNITYRKNKHDAIEKDSLLEYLYVHYTIKELEKMLAEKPDDKTLLKWKINAVSYHAVVRRAIALIKDD